MNKSNEIYYRIMIDKKDNIPIICELQWFDEFGYDKTKWLTEEKFKTRPEAVDWIRKNYYAKDMMAIADYISINDNCQCDTCVYKFTTC